MTDSGETDIAREGRPAAGLPDTPIRNPLDAATRQLVATWLAEMAAGFTADLATGPSDAELAEFAIDQAEWIRRSHAAIADLRRDSALVDSDELQFSTAARLRDLLGHAERHALIGACAALDTAITAALPERRRALEELVKHHKETRGFHIHGVGGRGQPLPLPPFTYTDGLAARVAHPELVIVGVAGGVAGAILADLGSEIVRGERSLAPGEDLDGLVANALRLRVTACPPALLAQTHPDPEHMTGALQILLPDDRGRFPGDADVDAEFAAGQTYPDDEAPGSS